MIVVAFLLPLAAYCLILGLINRRRHPLLVSAAWDFAGLLFAASGFLAFGLPGILNGFTERGRSTALFGRSASGGGAWASFADLFDGLCSTLFNVGNVPSSSPTSSSWSPAVPTSCGDARARPPSTTSTPRPGRGARRRPRRRRPVVVVRGNRYFIARAQQGPPARRQGAGGGHGAGTPAPGGAAHAYPTSVEDVDGVPTWRWSRPRPCATSRCAGNRGRGVAETGRGRAETSPDRSADQRQPDGRLAAPRPAPSCSSRPRWSSGWSLSTGCSSSADRPVRWAYQTTTLGKRFSSRRATSDSG